MPGVIPCHRVVNRGGPPRARLCLRQEDQQKALLEAEEAWRSARKGSISPATSGGPALRKRPEQRKNSWNRKERRIKTHRPMTDGPVRFVFQLVQNALIPLCPALLIQDAAFSEGSARALRREPTFRQNSARFRPIPSARRPNQDNGEKQRGGDRNQGTRAGAFNCQHIALSGERKPTGDIGKAEKLQRPDGNAEDFRPGVGHKQLYVGFRKQGQEQYRQQRDNTACNKAAFSIARTLENFPAPQLYPTAGAAENRTCRTGAAERIRLRTSECRIPKPPSRRPGARMTFIQDRSDSAGDVVQKVRASAEAICRNILPLKWGLQNHSSALPRKNGTKAITAQTSMPEQVAKAAPQIPQPEHARNRNSSTALKIDIRIFKTCCRVCIRRF